MKKYVMYAGMALLMLTVVPVQAAKPVQTREARPLSIVLKAGFGNIQVKDEFAINGVTEEQDIASAGLFAAYTFPSGFVVEAGFSGETSDDIFESYDLFQTIGMAGYTFRPATSITIVPKIGFSMWELDTFESGIFHLIGGDEEHSYDGTDMIWSVEGEYSITQLVQLNLSYTQGSYEFGDLNSYRFGVEFDF